MERKEVLSSNITSIGYDREKKILEVQFHNGKVYQYYPITERGYKDLVEAESIGKYFFKFIRNNRNVTTTQIS